MTTDIINELFELAVKHRDSHDCSAYPYEHGEKLLETLIQSKAQSVLEVGTGIGFTATLMALSSQDALIDTIEKDPEHAQMATEFVAVHGVSEQITIINESAEIYLPTVGKHYDLIFFDGYQIHYEFLPQYERLLKAEGILFLANNHLKSRTSDRFFAELQDTAKWKIIEQFADTTIAQRLAK